MNFTDRVYHTVKLIPKGKVSTYSLVAKRTGKPKASRAVGNALNKNPYKTVPCHRVIRSDGTVGGYAKGTKNKIKILQKEGVGVKSGRVLPGFILRRL